MPRSTPIEDYWAMLRSLLRDRFKLVVTIATKEMQTEALVVHRPNQPLGPGISKSRVDCSRVDTLSIGKPGEPRLCHLVNSTKRAVTGSRLVTIHGRSVALTVLADYLSNARKVPVVDRTELAGAFDFDVEFQSESLNDPVISHADAPRLAIALEEQLGLALRPTRALIEVLVIEKAELPTPN